MKTVIVPGDIVRLTSGGPIMTVSRIDKPISPCTLAMCDWFDENSAAIRGSFVLSALTRVTSRTYLAELRETAP